MEWIDIKDRLPKRNETVDLWIVGDSNTVNFYDTSVGRHAKQGRTTNWLWDGQRWCATGGLSMFLSSGVEVTHWMPLPAPPTKQEERY